MLPFRAILIFTDRISGFSRGKNACCCLLENLSLCGYKHLVHNRTHIVVSKWVRRHVLVKADDSLTICSSIRLERPRPTFRAT